MPRVYNKHHGPKPPQNAVYIGRPTKWGNPFVIGADGTRMEVIRKYREYLLNNPKLMEAARIELAGRDLLCFCAPLACHGDVLLEISNSYTLGDLLSTQNRRPHETKGQKFKE